MLTIVSLFNVADVSRETSAKPSLGCIKRTAKAIKTSEKKATLRLIWRFIEEQQCGQVTDALDIFAPQF